MCILHHFTKLLSKLIIIYYIFKKYPIFELILQVSYTFIEAYIVMLISKR